MSELQKIYCVVVVDEDFDNINTFYYGCFSTFEKAVDAFKKAIADTKDPSLSWAAEFFDEFGNPTFNIQIETNWEGEMPEECNLYWYLQESCDHRLCHIELIIEELDGRIC